MRRDCATLTYHGEPYATRYLVKEAFDSPTHKVKITAAVLRERLPHAIALATEREKKLYHATHVSNQLPSIKSLIDFVELCERKEQETGEPLTITASF